MNFTQFLLILRARYKIILITLLVTVTTTVAVSLLLPKTYKASTSLVLNFKGADPVTGMALTAQLMPGYVPTQIDIITSRRVALKVVDDLKLAEGGAVQKQFLDATDGKGTIRDWLADALLKGVEVVPSRESSVLELTYKGSDPQFAAAIANAFAAAYQQISIQLKVEPAQKASGYFNEQIKQLREKLELAQNKVSTYQQEHGIVNADNRLDVESARLNELSSQLVMAQGQAMEAGSRQRQAQGATTVSPDVMANPVVQNIKLSLSMAEVKFAETSQKLDKNHPQYQAAKSEVDKLRSNLEEQIKLASSGVAGNAHIFQQRETEIRAALAAQKAKVMALSGARDEIKVLVNEMETAQRAYEGASLRFNQTNMEGQSNQTDIAVLNPAVAPLLPAGPKVLLNTLVSIFLGTMLGLGFAMLAELMNRRVRSAEDLLEMLKVPVLGEVNWSAPRRKRFSLFNRALQNNLNSH
ncbi:chain length determinant protein EpsF [Undibacterium sp.]|uniref:chain length determinant protein EpsF n=1 Tax=Undibacterium sp. TaxID=1914977 RepID=UPI0025E6B91D|nr:chain length determinant protein EpsF [Undibacterium sp.]